MVYPKNFKKFTFCLLLTTVVSVLLTDLLLARAGGGESYGGGGASFGGGNGGGGDGMALYFLIHLALHNPVIGIPLLVGFIAFMALGGKKARRGHQKRIIRRGVQRQNQERKIQHFEKIKKTDSHFDPQKIVVRIKKAFVKVQEDWSQQKMSSSRVFITDGISERYAIQFEIQKKKKMRNRMENLTIHNCEIVGVEADTHFQTLHFKIQASANDYWVSLVDNKIIKGTPQHTNAFTEYWTFIRRPGTQTKEQPGLIEGFCPNCGSPLKMNQSTKCDACSSLISSGEYDWILAKITQDAEWRFQNSKRKIEGVSTFHGADPAFNVPFIEDRAAVVFWRYQKALLEKSENALLKVAHPEFVQKFKTNELSKNYYYEDLSVGLSEVYKVEFGEEYDKVYIQVKWGGRKKTDDSPQKPPVNFYSHLITMVRRHGTVTDIKKGLSSLHCIGCGAPQTISHQETCEYCGLHLGKGEKDWVLFDFSPHFLTTVTLRQKKYTLEKEWQPHYNITDPVSLLSGLVQVMMADGKMSSKEKKLLDEFVKNRHIPKERLEEIKVVAMTGQLQATAPFDPLEGSLWVDSMVEMCYADGDVSSHERNFLIKFGKKVGIMPRDIDLKIAKTRTRLYQEARASLKKMPNSQTMAL